MKEELCIRSYFTQYNESVKNLCSNFSVLCLKNRQRLLNRTELTIVLNRRPCKHFNDLRLTGLSVNPMLSTYKRVVFSNNVGMKPRWHKLRYLTTPFAPTSIAVNASLSLFPRPCVSTRSAQLLNPAPIGYHTSP